MKKLISILLIIATLISSLMLTVSAEEFIVSDEGRLPFEDVKEDYWFYEAVEVCYANGIINGMNEYTFDHSGQLTRAQFVMMLAAFTGIDTSAYTTDRFTDVKPGHWYYGAVAWAGEGNIVSGMTKTTFEPNSSLTRAQLAVMMQYYMQDTYDVEVSEDVLDKYSDKPKEEYWYYDAMKYAVAAGLISGVTPDTLAATDTVTRAQAAVIFEKFAEQYGYSFCEHSFSEATCTKASVCTKCSFVKGLPTGHKVDASYNCKTEGKCKVCSAKVEKSKILHDFSTANCGNPRVCKRCGEKRGTPTGEHNWWQATCTNPKMCKVCYRTEGKALGHYYSGNYCTRCGELTPHAKASYYLKQRGDRYSKNSYASWCVSLYGATGAVYNATTGDLGIFFGNYYDNGSFYATVVYLPKTGTTCRFEYISENSSGTVTAHGVGYFDASTYKYGANPNFTSYEGNASNYDTALSRARGGIEVAIKLGYKDFESWCYVSLSDFGFVNYK